MYYKLGQASVINCDRFVLLKIRQTLLKIEAGSFYKLEPVLFKIGAAITNWDNYYYKRGQLLQIGAKFITNWDRYYKLRQSLPIGV